MIAAGFIIGGLFAGVSQWITFAVIAVAFILVFSGFVNRRLPVTPNAYTEKRIRKDGEG